MAVYRVSAPDGSEWEVTAPDNADEASVLRYAKAQFGQMKSAPKPATTLDRAAAGASGYNAAMLAGFPGMAVDTALNVADLARAAYGAGGKSLGLIKTEDMPGPLDRGGYVGSSEWIRNRIRDAGGSALIDNPRPDDDVSRILHTMGMSAAGARTGGQVAAGAAAGASQGVAQEMGLGVPGQIIASMGPQAAGAVVRAGTRVGVGGTEAQRRQMRENIDTMRAAGVDNPSAGVVGTRQAAALESAGSRYPGSSGVVASNAQATQAALGEKVRSVADEASMNRGEAPTGQATQQDITGRWKQKFDQLYENLDMRVQDKVGDKRVPIENTLNASGMIASGIPGAPNISQVLLGGSGIPRLDVALRADANIPAQALRERIPVLEANLAEAQSRFNRLVQEGGVAQAFANDANYRGNNWTPVQGMPRVSGQVSNFPDRAAEGASAYSDISRMIPDRKAQILQAAQDVNDAQAALAATRPTLPYPALRATGTMIGSEAGDKLLHGNVESGRYKQVYGAIAADKGAAAAAAGAERDLARANNFYSSGADKMDTILSPFTKPNVGPEQAYSQFRSMVLSSPTKAAALRASLSPEVRKMQTATLIDELGQATPGRQNAEGSQFSSETFLTNWNKISPSAKKVIFSGFQGAGELRDSMEAVAKAAELIRAKGGVYANPSGTAGATAQIGVGGSIAYGIATGNVPLVAGVLGSVAGANITARMMTNPKFVNWLAQSGSVIKPETANSHIRRLAVIANGADPQTRADIEKFAASLSQQ